MDGFELNKIAGAILLAGVTAMSISMVVGGLYGEQLHHGEEPKRGYQIEVAEESSSSGAAVEEAPVDIAQYFAQASVEKGQSLTKACAACHGFDEGGAHKVGPNLWNIVGQKLAHHTDYSYSNAMASHGGEWDYQSLSLFLEKPKKFVPGTKMAYAGMKKPEDRASLILYLHSLSNSPLPLPEPPAAAEEAVPADVSATPEAVDTTPTEPQKSAE